MKSTRLPLTLSIVVITLLFLFMPHTIELTGTLETWFPFKGLTLYKDISMFHFPLGRLPLYPLHIITNWDLRFDPFVGLAVGILTLITLYKFGKRFLSVGATGVALLFFTCFYWYLSTAILYFHEQLIGLLLLIAIYLFFEIRSVNPRTASFDWKIFLIGLTLSVAEFSGQIATLTVAALSLLTFFTIFKQKGSKRKLLLFITGLIIPPLIISLYFFSKNALYEFWFWNTAYYLIYSSFTKQTPLNELPLVQLLAFYSPLFITFLLKPKSIIFFLTLSTMPFILFSIYHPHHANYALPLLAITAGYTFDFFQKSKVKTLTTIFVGLFCLITAYEILPWYFKRLKPLSFPNTKIVNDLYADDPMYDAVAWIKENTNDSDRLMVVGDPLFYMRADKLPSARPAKSIPYSWEPLDKISREIRQTPADYWIIDTGSVKRIREVNNKPHMADFINDELAGNYQKEVTFKNWEIWKQK